MHVRIGTKNKRKVAITQEIFMSLLKQEFEVLPCDAESGVPDAPHDQETYQGALNRAIQCREYGDADYFVGIESGLVNRYGNMFEEAWAVIMTKDGRTLIGYSSGLLLPPVVVKRMNEGKLHNNIMEELDRELDLPYKNHDTWSRYTGGGMSREVSIEEALRNALIQLHSSENNLYKP